MRRGIKESKNVSKEVDQVSEDFAFGDVEVDETSNREFLTTKQKVPISLGATKEELEKSGVKDDELKDVEDLVDDDIDDSGDDDEFLEDETVDDDDKDVDEDEGLEEGEEEDFDEVEGEETDELALQITDREHKKLTALSKDDLIAKIVDSRQRQAVEQSKKDILINGIGTDFANEIFAGKIGHVAKRLLADLKDETFQQHVVEFYDSHNIKDGRYVRTKDVVPSIGILQNYQNLLLESQQIDPQSFMPKDEQFDSNESYSRGSNSYIAREKYEMKKIEIQNKITDILNTSEKQSNEEQKLVTASAKRAEDEFGKLKLRFKSLQNPKTEDDFKTWLAEARNEPITSFWFAYLYNKQRNGKLKILDQNETRAIKKGGKKLKISGKKVKTRPVKTKRLVEDDTFGDLP